MMRQSELAGSEPQEVGRNDRPGPLGQVTDSEYSLLLVLIGAAALFVLTAMGTSISAIFSKINVRLEGANQSIS